MPRSPSNPMSGLPYVLSQYAFLRRVHHHWVILDLREDQYLCLSCREFDRVAPDVEGLCAEDISNASNRGLSADPASQLALELQQSGILSTNPSMDRPIAKRRMPKPSCALGTAAAPPSLVSRAACAPGFLGACIRTDYRMRHLPLLRIVTLVADRKASASTSNPDVNRVRTTIESYHSMRLLYPRSYLCLFDCLSLLELLARRSFYPDWVFGVTTDPFEAHCWLQVGHVVINDTMDRVTRFEPIMAV